MNFKGKDCISHMLQRLAEMDEHVDNSFKQRGEYLCRSLVIVYTEDGQCLGILHTGEVNMPRGG